ncbi:MAG TPA: hypothetical protein VMH34_04650 [Gammaproteobacteria bacterium]|nr:hypothetical protein [Gammaproteobacteria bacterium]
MRSKSGRIKPLTIAIGAAFSVNLMPVAAVAADNPFEYSQLASGYLVADHEGGGSSEGKCGQGKCGVARMDTDGDGKVSKDEFMKTHKDESKFAALDTNHDGFLDADEIKKMKEGKCGEGKCGVHK